MGRPGVILDRQGYNLSSFSVSFPMMAILHLQMIFFFYQDEDYFPGLFTSFSPHTALVKKVPLYFS